mmetsp:Transcript_3397/g.9482  ORF Transcript_3397/g.9482 Transcript_3397/m.9482 type:complete len:234 (-) Transcript_3397:7647-8348(-)
MEWFGLVWCRLVSFRFVSSMISADVPFFPSRTIPSFLPQAGDRLGPPRLCQPLRTPTLHRRSDPGGKHWLRPLERRREDLRAAGVLHRHRDLAANRHRRTAAVHGFLRCQQPRLLAPLAPLRLCGVHRAAGGRLRLSLGGDFLPVPTRSQPRCGPGPPHLAAPGGPGGSLLGGPVRDGDALRPHDLPVHPGAGATDAAQAAGLPLWQGGRSDAGERAGLRDPDDRSGPCRSGS